MHIFVYFIWYIPNLFCVILVFISLPELSISNFLPASHNRILPPTNKVMFALQPSTPTGRRVGDVELNYFRKCWKFQTPVSLRSPKNLLSSRRYPLGRRLDETRSGLFTVSVAAATELRSSSLKHLLY